MSRPKRLREHVDFMTRALVTIIRQQEIIMVQNANLDQAVADLTAAVGVLAENAAVLDAEVVEAMAKIKDAAAAGDLDAVKAAVAKVTEVSGKMATDAANLKDALTPPAPAPAAEAPPPQDAPVAEAPALAESEPAPVAPAPAPSSEPDPEAPAAPVSA